MASDLSSTEINEILDDEKEEGEISLDDVSSSEEGQVYKNQRNANGQCRDCLSYKQCAFWCRSLKINKNIQQDIGLNGKENRANRRHVKTTAELPYGSFSRWKKKKNGDLEVVADLVPISSDSDMELVGLDANLYMREKTKLNKNKKKRRKKSPNPVSSSITSMDVAMSIKESIHNHATSIIPKSEKLESTSGRTKHRHHSPVKKKIKIIAKTSPISKKRSHSSTGTKSRTQKRSKSPSILRKPSPNPRTHKSSKKTSPVPTSNDSENLPETPSPQGKVTKLLKKVRQLEPFSTRVNKKRSLKDKLSSIINKKEKLDNNYRDETADQKKDEFVSNEKKVNTEKEHLISKKDVKEKEECLDVKKIEKDDDVVIIRQIPLDKKNTKEIISIPEKIITKPVEKSLSPPPVSPFSMSPLSSPLRSSSPLSLSPPPETGGSHKLPNFCIDENDEDLKLRMEALRSAVLKKHQTRMLSGTSKKKQKQIQEKNSTIAIPQLESPFSSTFLENFPMLTNICSPTSPQDFKEEIYCPEDMELDSDMELSNSPYSPTDEINDNVNEFQDKNISLYSPSRPTETPNFKFKEKSTQGLQVNGSYLDIVNQESRPYSPSDMKIYDPDLPGVHSSTEHVTEPLHPPPVPPLNLFTPQPFMLGCPNMMNAFTEPLPIVPTHPSLSGFPMNPIFPPLVTYPTPPTSSASTTTMTTSMSIPMMKMDLKNIPQQQSCDNPVNNELDIGETDLDGSPLVQIENDGSKSTSWPLLNNKRLYSSSESEKVFNSSSLISKIPPKKKKPIEAIRMKIRPIVKKRIITKPNSAFNVFIDDYDEDIDTVANQEHQIQTEPLSKTNKLSEYTDNLIRITPLKRSRKRKKKKEMLQSQISLERVVKENKNVELNDRSIIGDDDEEVLRKLLLDALAKKTKNQQTSGVSTFNKVINTDVIKNNEKVIFDNNKSKDQGFSNPINKSVNFSQEKPAATTFTTKQTKRALLSSEEPIRKVAKKLNTVPISTKVVNNAKRYQNQLRQRKLNQQKTLIETKFQTKINDDQVENPNINMSTAESECIIIKLNEDTTSRIENNETKSKVNHNKPASALPKENFEQSVDQFLKNLRHQQESTFTPSNKMKKKTSETFEKASIKTELIDSSAGTNITINNTEKTSNCLSGTSIPSTVVETTEISKFDNASAEISKSVTSISATATKTNTTDAAVNTSPTIILTTTDSIIDNNDSSSTNKTKSTAPKNPSTPKTTSILDTITNNGTVTATTTTTVGLDKNKVGSIPKILKNTVELSNFSATPQAVKHLPVSAQEEYRRLKQRLIDLQKAKESISTNPAISSSTPKATNTTTSKTGSKIQPTILISPISKHISETVPKIVTPTKIVKTTPICNNKKLPASATNVGSISGENTVDQSESIQTSNTNTSKSNWENYKKQINDEVQSLSDLSPEDKTELLAATQDELIAKRYSVLSHIMEMSTNLHEWETERDIQIRMNDEVKKLREQLRKAEEELQKHKEKLNSIQPKISSCHEKINEGRKECFRLSKICNGIGLQVVGFNYKVPSAAAELLNNKVKEIAQHTQKLRTKKVKETPQTSLQKSNETKIKHDPKANHNFNFHKISNQKRINLKTPDNTSKSIDANLKISIQPISTTDNNKIASKIPKTITVLSAQTINSKIEKNMLNDINHTISNTNNEIKNLPFNDNGSNKTSTLKISTHKIEKDSLNNTINDTFIPFDSNTNKEKLNKIEIKSSPIDMVSVDNDIKKDQLTNRTLTFENINNTKHDTTISSLTSENPFNNNTTINISDSTLSTSNIEPLNTIISMDSNAMQPTLAESITNSTSEEKVEIENSKLSFTNSMSINIEKITNTENSDLTLTNSTPVNVEKVVEADNGQLSVTMLIDVEKANEIENNELSVDNSTSMEVETENIKLSDSVPMNVEKANGIKNIELVETDSTPMDVENAIETENNELSIINSTPMNVEKIVENINNEVNVTESSLIDVEKIDETKCSELNEMNSVPMDVEKIDETKRSELSEKKSRSIQSDFVSNVKVTILENENNVEQVSEKQLLETNYSSSLLIQTDRPNDQNIESVSTFSDTQNLTSIENDKELQVEIASSELKIRRNLGQQNEKISELIPEISSYGSRMNIETEMIDESETEKVNESNIKKVVELKAKKNIEPEMEIAAKIKTYLTKKSNNSKAVTKIKKKKNIKKSKTRRKSKRLNPRISDIKIEKMIEEETTSRLFSTSDTFNIPQTEQNLMEISKEDMHLVDLNVDQESKTNKQSETNEKMELEVEKQVGETNITNNIFSNTSAEIRKSVNSENKNQSINTSINNSEIEKNKIIAEKPSSESNITYLNVIKTEPVESETEKQLTEFDYNNPLPLEAKQIKTEPIQSNLKQNYEKTASKSESGTKTETTSLTIMGIKEKILHAENILNKVMQKLQAETNIKNILSNKKVVNNNNNDKPSKTKPKVVNKNLVLPEKHKMITRSKSLINSSIQSNENYEMCSRKSKSKFKESTRKNKMNNTNSSTEDCVNNESKEQEKNQSINLNQSVVSETSLNNTENMKKDKLDEEVLPNIKKEIDFNESFDSNTFEAVDGTEHSTLLEEIALLELANAQEVPDKIVHKPTRKELAIKQEPLESLIDIRKDVANNKFSSQIPKKIEIQPYESVLQHVPFTVEKKIIPPVKTIQNPEPVFKKAKYRYNSKRIMNKEMPSSHSKKKFIQPYESILRHLNTPRYTKTDGILCPYQLRGTCHDGDCPFVHQSTSHS